MSRETLTLSLLACAAIPKEGGACAALAILNSAGGRFVSLPDYGPHPRPETAIARDGCIYAGASYQHRSLAQDHYFRYSLARGRLSPDSAGVATFSFLADSAAVLLHHLALDCSPEEVDRLADGLVAMGRILWPLLLPAYGSVDYQGANTTDAAAARAGDVQYLYWANLFGRTVTRRLGDSFFLRVPSGSVEALADEVILYRVTGRFADWGNRPRAEIVRHFREAYPALERYYPAPADTY
jgi:hypothetical protein